MKAFVDDEGDLLLTKPSIIKQVVKHPRHGKYAVEFLVGNTWMHSQPRNTFTEANDYRRKLIAWAMEE